VLLRSAAAADWSVRDIAFGGFVIDGRLPTKGNAEAYLQRRNATARFVYLPEPR
jgi:hypothetical protein